MYKRDVSRVDKEARDKRPRGFSQIPRRSYQSLRSMIYAGLASYATHSVNADGIRASNALFVDATFNI